MSDSCHYKNSGFTCSRLRMFCRSFDCACYKRFFLLHYRSSFQTLEKVVDAVRGQRGGALLNGLTRVWRSISR